VRHTGERSVLRSRPFLVLVVFPVALVTCSR